MDQIKNSKSKLLSYVYIFLDIATIGLLAVIPFDLCSEVKFSEYIISIGIILISYLLWRPLPFILMFASLLSENGSFSLYLLASFLMTSYVLKNKLKTIFQAALFLWMISCLFSGYDIFTHAMTRGLDCWAPNISIGELYAICSILTTMTITRLATPLLSKVKKSPGIKLSIVLIILALVSLYFASIEFAVTMNKWLPVKGMIY
ncbi:MAG: hypothetical protein MNSN_03680 [Minisyncoccus archaeiphilus]|jgi:hypothetical protein|uniref:hypothetical protein n=1 Tax=Minisyncoccus archaeiphilus TaxID=3238481 RepID=UPI002B1A4051|nr:MAG: hypothetical protein MNSN_03680 [Candidatus Parcubacteria bacterium]